MKFLFCLFSILFLVINATFSQAKYDYNWLFGRGFPTMSGDGTLINFNDNPSTISFKEIGVTLEQTNTTISDKDGNLLFYTNGCHISDITNDLMMNGDSLNPGRLHTDFWCESGGYSVVQGVLSLPKPNNENEYLLFHVKDTLVTDPVIDVYGDILYCTTIDMSLNNGLGAVTKKNEVVIQDSLNNGGLTAVRHMNNIDWWVLMPKDQSNGYFTLLLTENGIDTIFEQSIGISIAPGGGGQAVFSPDGTMYARYNPFDDLVVYDFDRSTGLLSNFRHAIIEDEDTVAGGIAISPNSRFVYCSAKFHVYQFDLEADNLAASMEIVATYDGYFSPFATNFYLAQLAPDCRIYINSTNTVDVLHVINHPDEKGIDCDVAQHSIQLENNHVFSIPNYPNYRLGQGPVCDTSFIVAQQNVLVPKSDITVFPNPAKEVINIKFGSLTNDPVVIKIRNSLGVVVKEKVVSFNASAEHILLDHLVSGIYFLEVEIDGEIKHIEKVLLFK